MKTYFCELFKENFIFINTFFYDFILFFFKFTKKKYWLILLQKKNVNKMFSKNILFDKVCFFYLKNSFIFY